MIDDLENGNRVTIFKKIGVDDHNKIKEDIISSIADSQHEEFFNFCDTVYNNKDNIASIDAEVESDGRVNFIIEDKLK